MAGAYKTPGVYIEEIPRFPPSVVPVETAIPAFIGYTEKAEDVIADDLRLKPIRISSIADYKRYFGEAQKETAITVAVTIDTPAGPNPPGEKAVPTLAASARSKHIMFYALQMFFANGGGPCYVVSVGTYKTPVGTPLAMKDLSDGLDAVRTVDEPTLLVFPEAQSLSLGDFGTLHQAALLQCSELQDRFVIMDVPGVDKIPADETAAAKLRAAIDAFRGPGGIGANNLKYGAAYVPNIATVLDFAYDESATMVTITTDGVAPPPAEALKGLEADKNRVYQLVKSVIADMDCTLPPSSAMAGIYAAVDASRGVWKCPANVSVNAATTPTVLFTNKDQEDMNVDATGGKSVNAIRPFIGRGTMVWGGRTLAGNDNEWRYINVRRLFIFVEESVKKATEQFVFEANDANTWVKVQGMIENFLTTIWRQGALQGVKPEHAFYVAVGLGKTMTALDILEGRMIVEIGMAAVRPAEFIILRFSHKMAES